MKTTVNKYFVVCYLLSDTNSLESVYHVVEFTNIYKYKGKDGKSFVNNFDTMEEAEEALRYLPGDEYVILPRYMVTHLKEEGNLVSNENTGTNG